MVEANFLAEMQDQLEAGDDWDPALQDPRAMSNTIPVSGRPTILHKSQADRMEGMLLKHSPALLVSWQERRVVLENHQLRYFKKSDTKQWDELAGVLNFDLYKCTVSQFEKDNTIEIQVTGLDRKFLFKCDQAKSRVIWFQNI